MSTCRFAQRVARVKNDARLNEEVDPAVIIRQLKARVATLEEELAVLKGDVVRAPNFLLLAGYQELMTVFRVCESRKKVTS